MGLAKRELEAYLENGWSSPEGNVCANCVNDTYLKDLINENLASKKCDYCERSNKVCIAAPVDTIMEPIAHALFIFFIEPTQAGGPYDSEWLIQPISTEAALLSIPLDCNDNLLHEIAGSFSNDTWVPTVSGDWRSIQQHVELSYSWRNFVHIVKHQTRYFFWLNSR